MVAKIRDARELLRERVSDPDSMYAKILKRMRKGRQKGLSELASELGVALSTVSTPVSEMEYLGWLEGRRDNRRKMVALTMEGAAIRKQVRPARKGITRDISGLSPKRKRVQRVLPITPKKPLENILNQVEALASVGDRVFWCDKYMDDTVFEVVIDAVKKRKSIREFRLLTTPKKVNKRFRELAARAKTDLANRGIAFEARILHDKKEYKAIHDRFIIGDSHCYLAAPHQSVDRGSLSMFVSIDDEIEEITPYLEQAWDSAVPVE